MNFSPDYLSYFLFALLIGLGLATAKLVYDIAKCGLSCLCKKLCCKSSACCSGKGKEEACCKGDDKSTECCQGK